MESAPPIKTNSLDSSSTRPTSLELNPLESFNSQELQHLYEHLKNSPTLQNGLFNLNKASPLIMNNLNSPSQQFISFYSGLAASPQAHTRLAGSAGSPGVIFLTNPSPSRSTNSSVLLDGSNSMPLPLSVNLCSPVALTTSNTTQPATLANYTPNVSSGDLLQPVLLQTQVSMQKSLDFSGSSGQTAASGSRPHNESADSSQIQRLERKRARNRDAAKKCRERKLKLIHSLQGYVQQLVEDNKSLRSTINKERDEVKRLKSFVVDHMEKDCELVKNPSTRSKDEVKLPSKKRKPHN